MKEVTINLRLGFLSANHTLDAIGFRRRAGRKRILLAPDWYKKLTEREKAYARRVRTL